MLLILVFEDSLWNVGLQHIPGHVRRGMEGVAGGEGRSTSWTGSHSLARGIAWGTHPCAWLCPLVWSFLGRRGHEGNDARPRTFQTWISRQKSKLKVMSACLETLLCFRLSGRTAVPMELPGDARGSPCEWLPGRASVPAPSQCPTLLASNRGRARSGPVQAADVGSFPFSDVVPGRGCGICHQK